MSFEVRQKAFIVCDIRQRLETSVGVEIPSGKKSFWHFGIGVHPLSFHSESPAAQRVQSGITNDSGSIFATIGGEYRMNRETRVFYRLKAQQYKVQFTGDANTTDPVTGVAPSNVPISNNFLIFDLGINFGR